MDRFLIALDGTTAPVDRATVERLLADGQLLWARRVSGLGTGLVAAALLFLLFRRRGWI